jgi:hypothetical protein
MRSSMFSSQVTFLFFRSTAATEREDIMKIMERITANGNPAGEAFVANTMDSS